MWIVPKNLPASLSAQVMAGLNLDCNEQSEISAQSFMWRSSASRAPTWSQRWKRVTWMQHLSGRILKPSMDSRFADEWTSSLGDILVSPGPTPASGKARTTLDTFGRILQRSCEQFSLFGASSRTSPDTCPLDSPPFIEAYELWATKLRQDCLRRQSAVRPTSGNGCSSWPTARVQMTRNAKEDRHKCNLEEVVQSAVQMFPTPRSSDSKQHSESKIQRVKDGTMDVGKCQLREIVQDGPPDPASPSTNGKSPGLWSTPGTVDAQKQETPEDWEARNKRKKADNPNLGELHLGLATQVQGLPQRGKASPSTNGKSPGLWQTLKSEAWYRRQAAKLNPLWVSQLMGVPVGWCDPEWINSGSSETESSPPRPNSPSEPYTKGRTMNSRPRNWLLLILLFLVGCVPIDPPVVDPPEPPILTMTQRQKRLMEEFKLTGFMPHSGGYYVLVEEKP